MIGRTIGHFQITAELGKGGMGVVYCAHDSNLDRDVALKFLPAHLTADKSARARFIHEAKAASSLQHPAICTIHEIGETDDGLTFLVMPCYEGETLQDRIARGPLPVEEAVAIFRQVAQGLALAHEQGLVHRDIKPANIFLTKTGQAVILDFGLAKLTGQTQLTQEGSTLGTVAYMSPEQAQGEEAGPESDFWSLGVILYEMLTGRQPFTGEHPQAVLYAIGQVEPTPLTGVPDEIVELVNGLLGKERDQRRTAAEKLLPRYLEGGTVHLTGVGAGSRKWLGMGVFLIVLVMAIGGWFLWGVVSDAGIDSIAVLPFEDLSADKDQEYVSDGMTDQLISRLGTLGVFNKVISRSSVMRYKDDPKPAAEVGEELDVRALVEGTITFAGDRARVTAKLIDATTDKQLWSDSFDEPVTNILDLQTKIVRAIVGAIEKTLSPEAEKWLAQKRPVDPKAYRAYLRGVHWLNNASSGEEYQLVERSFIEAIEADSTFAPPYAGLAEFHTRRTHTSTGIAPEDAVPTANKYLAKAFELDPNLAEAYMTQGHLQWEHEYKMPEAGASLHKAIELNPNLAYAHMIYSYWLTNQGRYEEAVAAAKKSIELDPLSLLVYSVVGYPLRSAGEYDLALEVAQQTKEKFPSWNGMNIARLNIANAKKDWQECLTISNKIIEESQDQKTILTRKLLNVWYLQLLGEEDQARNLFNSIEEAAIEQNLIGELASTYWDLGEKEKALSFFNKWLDSDDYSPISAAQGYAVAGDFDKAFAELEKAYDLKINWLTRLKLHFSFPDYDEFRADPRYQEFAAKLGVVG